MDFNYNKLFITIYMVQCTLSVSGQFNSKYSSRIDLKEVSSKVCNTKILQDTEVAVELVIRLESTEDERVDLVETWTFPRELSDNKGNTFKVVESKIEKPTNENILLSYTIIEKHEKVKGTWKLKLHHKNKLILEREFFVN